MDSLEQVFQSLERQIKITERKKNKSLVEQNQLALMKANALNLDATVAFSMRIQ
jgi:hypothetical protein